MSVEPQAPRLPDPADIESALAIVRAVLPPTPQFRWPLLCERLGTEVWMKHENHSPVGAFKLRGGLVYCARLAAGGGRGRGLVTATRGNHGQSIPFAASRHGMPVTVVVPHGNSREKNAAMRALGATLIEHGDDFQAAAEHAALLAQRDGLHRVPSFHPDLVAGVATASVEFFTAIPDIDVAYVPIGMGSGACAMAAARAALGVRTRIVGVVSRHAPAYARAIASGTPRVYPATTELADGLACSTPDDAALACLSEALDHVVEVSDRDIAAAMRMLFECTHNVAEGAGAAAWAAAYAERATLGGQRVAVLLTGGNVDRVQFARVLGEPLDAWQA